MIEGDRRDLTFPREIRKLSVGTRRRSAIPPMKNDSLSLLSRRPLTSALVLSMAIASAICGLAQGKATAAAAEALARNPAARPGIQLALILGLALIESLALYTLLIIFIKVK